MNTFCERVDRVRWRVGVIRMMRIAYPVTRGEEQNGFGAVYLAQHIVEGVLVTRTLRPYRHYLTRS